MSDDDGWLRLHPLSVLVNLLPRLWATARSLWPLLLAWAFGRVSGAAVFDLAILAMFLLPAVFGTAVHWATLRYRLRGDQLEIDTGLLRRTHRSIARDRVQNVEVVRNVFHRLAGLAEVRVETASGTEVEGLLSALSVAEAEALVLALRPSSPPASDDVPETPAPAVELLAQPSVVDLLWTGATGLRLATVGVALGFAVQLLGERAGPSGADMTAVARGAGLLQSLAIVALVGASGFWVSVATTFLRHAGFRLEARGERLSVEEGLFTRRRTELPRDRVQLVTFEQGLVRRWLGFGVLSLETAAARQEGDGTERSSARVPWVADADVAALIARVLPAGTDPADLSLSRPHPSAGPRAAAVAGVLAVAAAGVASWLFGPVGAVALLGVPFAAGVAWQTASHQRWAVTEDLVVTRTGWLSHQTSLVPRPKIQSVATFASPLLQRAGLARLTVRIAGRALVLPLMEREVADDLLVRLSRHPG